MREFQFSSMPRPLSAPPAGLMSSSADKELEIGAGDGQFALRRAGERPDCHFIAIEKTRTLFERMQSQCHKTRRPNLWIFHTNAVWWITHFVPENSLNKIYILYPNPCIKNRQKNLRWFNRPFMPFLLKRLKTGGELEISTNNTNYYEECKEKMHCFPSVRQTQDLLNQTGTGQAEPAPKGLPFEKGVAFGQFSSHKANVKHAFSNKISIKPERHPPRTAFERKYMARGETCHSLTYTKTSY